MRSGLLLTLALGCTFLSTSHVVAAGDPGDGSLAARYKADARRIIDAALAGNDAYNKLETLCIEIGHRLSGSPQLERAVEWAVAAMKKDGQQNVRAERVMVPHWVRGSESATMISPRRQRLEMLGLGRSIGTPPQGITAPVVVVKDKEHLARIGKAAAGKIVLFNFPMPPYDPDHGAGYGQTVFYRTNGASLAAAQGAVAALVRSVTAKSLHTAHTGAMRYDPEIPKIPTAAVSIEDAETMARMTKRGIEVVVNLKMEAKTLPDAPSANVIGELRGRTHPEEIVVIGGHLDSWDVGHGAHDDGGGCVIAMEAINVLRKLNMIPRRTIRVVLFTNEENGLAGGKAYAADHARELKNHVAAIESDSGIFQPRGYSLECENDAYEKVALDQLRDIVRLLSPLGPMDAKLGGSGADIGPMKPEGVVLLGHRVEGSTYFDYHHTAADTIDKIDPVLLSKNVAVLATVAYILADMPDRIGTVPTPDASSH